MSDRTESIEMLEGRDYLVAHDIEEEYRSWLEVTRTAVRLELESESAPALRKQPGAWTDLDWRPIMSDSTCAVDGCESLARSRGWCAMHYSRWKRHGDPSIVLRSHRRTPKTLDEQVAHFINQVDWPTDSTHCWLWLGSLADGYGRVTLNGRAWVASRLAYFWRRGDLADGLVIDHLCRTPACVNPDHLELVTDAENIRRGMGPAALNARKTHCVLGHPLSGKNLYLNPDGKGRRCRECRRLAQVNRRAIARVEAERWAAKQ